MFPQPIEIVCPPVRPMCELIQMLCKDMQGRWRPGAAGYLLSQVRERRGRMTSLELAAHYEALALVRAARNFARRHRDRRLALIRDEALGALWASRLEANRQIGLRALDELKLTLLGEIDIEMCRLAISLR